MGLNLASFAYYCSGRLVERLCAMAKPLWTDIDTVYEITLCAHYRSVMRLGAKAIESAALRS